MFCCFQLVLGRENPTRRNPASTSLLRRWCTVLVNTTTHLMEIRLSAEWLVNPNFYGNCNYSERRYYCLTQGCHILSPCRSAYSNGREDALYHFAQVVVLFGFREQGGEQGACLFYYERLVQQTGAERTGCIPSGRAHRPPSHRNDNSGKASEFGPAGFCVSFVLKRLSG